MGEFVTYDLAFKLKEKGFKEKCYAYYFPKGSELIFNHNPFRGGIVEDCLYSNNSLPNECMASDFVDAPTISQVLKWLREEKKLNVNMRLYIEDKWYYTIQNNKGDFIYSHLVGSDFLHESYEESALAGIEYALDNLL